MKVSIDGGLTWHDSTHVQLVYKLDKDEPDYQYIVKYTNKQFTEILENGQDVIGKFTQPIKENVIDLEAC
jgi:hypothetical protein